MNYRTLGNKISLEERMIIYEDFKDIATLEEFLFVYEKYQNAYDVYLHFQEK